MERKKEIRTRLLNRRKALSIEERAWMSEAIIKRILRHPWFQEATTIYLYMSYREEVDTRTLLKEAIRMGKNVAVPKVRGKEMEFYYIEDCEELRPGMRGIPEPEGETISLANDESALILMPLVGFDKAGNRIGYGGGYYDRYLERHPSHPTIGLAYSIQEVDELPIEETDRRPDRIVTEEKEVNA